MIQKQVKNKAMVPFIKRKHIILVSIFWIQSENSQVSNDKAKGIINLIMLTDDMCAFIGHNNETFMPFMAPFESFLVIL